MRDVVRGGGEKGVGCVGGDEGKRLGDVVRAGEEYRGVGGGIGGGGGGS